MQGCIDKLNEWFKDHVTIFLTVGLALVVVQLSVLLCALLVCARRRKQVNVMASTTGITTSKSFKRHKRSEKNQTPRPERKSAAVQIHTIENNGFASQRKTYKTDSDILQNSLKPVNGTPKKLNEDFGDVRGKDSLSSLPLVLRNEHFHRFEESKPKLKFNSNSIRKNSSAAVNYNHHNETPSVYFTPHYYSHERNRDFYNDTEGYKQNEDVKSYFCKNEKYGIENSMYETCKDT